jgi:hypothetical protein
MSLGHHAGDSGVDVYHHSQWDEERTHRRKHNIAPVVVIATSLISVVIWVIPAKHQDKHYSGKVNQIDPMKNLYLVLCFKLS